MPSVAGKTYELFGAATAATTTKKFKCPNGEKIFVAQGTDKTYQGSAANLKVEFGPATNLVNADLEDSGTVTLTDNLITTINAPASVNNQVVGTWKQKKNKGALTKTITFTFESPEEKKWVDTFSTAFVNQAAAQFFGFTATVANTSIEFRETIGAVRQTTNNDGTFTESLELNQEYRVAGEIPQCNNNELKAKVARKMRGDKQGQFPISIANPQPPKKFKKFMVAEEVVVGGPAFGQTFTPEQDTELAEISLLLRPRVCIGTKKASGLKKEGVVATLVIYDDQDLIVARSADRTISRSSKRQNLAFDFTSTNAFLDAGETYRMELEIASPGPGNKEQVCGTTSKGVIVLPELDWYRTKLLDDPEVESNTYAGGDATVNGSPITEIVDFAFIIKEEE